MSRIFEFVVDLFNGVMDFITSGLYITAAILATIAFFKPVLIMWVTGVCAIYYFVRMARNDAPDGGRLAVYTLVYAAPFVFACLFFFLSGMKWVGFN